MPLVHCLMESDMLLTPMYQPLRFAFSTIALGFLALPLMADSVNGTIQLDGKAYPLNQAIGVRVASPFLAGALVTRVAFSDAAITQDQLRSNMGIMTRMKQSPIHGVSMEFSDDRSYFSLNIINSEQTASASLSGTMEQFTFKVHSPQQVSGNFRMPERSLGGLRLAIDLNFDVAISAAPVIDKGVIKKGAEAQTLPSVKAYLAMRRAVQAVDIPAIQKVARYPKDFEGPDGLKFVKMMKEEEPNGIVVVEAAEGADTATLTITGNKAGKQIRKTFDMQLKDGRWTTNNDNWEAN